MPIRSSAALVTLAAAFGPWTATAESEIERRRQHHGLVGVIGHWILISDDGPTLKVDGEQWRGTTTRQNLEAVQSSLFPRLSDSLVTNFTAEGAFPLAVFSDVRDFSTGTIRVQFRMIGGKSDQNAGIVISLGPSGEYLFVRYNTKDGNVAVWEYVGGARRVLAHGKEHQQLPLNTWQELVVTVSDTKVTGVVTGTPLTVVHSLARPVAGRVGLWTKRDAITAFKNFRVTK